MGVLGLRRGIVLGVCLLLGTACGSGAGQVRGAAEEAQPQSAASQAQDQLPQQTDPDPDGPTADRPDNQHEAAQLDPPGFPFDGTIRFVGVSTNFSPKTNTLMLEAEAPPGIEEGDVLLAQFFARSDPVTALNDGWELVDRDNQHQQSVWVKVVTAEEPSVYTWMQGDPERLGRSGVIIAAYRGVDPDSPIVTYGYHSDVGPTRQLTAPSVDVDVDEALVVRMWSTQSPGGSDLGIQPPFEVELVERGRVMVDIAARAAQTMADSVWEGGGSTGPAIATTTWDVDISYNHTVALRPLPPDAD
jgi:hypothetical protein